MNPSSKGESEKTMDARMTRWEYARVHVPVDMEYIQLQDQKIRVVDYLNYLGDKGWELVGVIPLGDSSGYIFFFKRPKDESLSPREIFEAPSPDPEHPESTSRDQSAT